MTYPEAAHNIIVAEISGGITILTELTKKHGAGSKNGPFLWSCFLPLASFFLHRPTPIKELGANPSVEEVRGQVVRLALPAIIEQVLMSLIHMVDMVMVGSLGAGAIAAVGLSNQPMFAAQALFSAVSVGNTALISRLMGARDIEGANHAAKQSLLLALVLSGLLTVFVWFAAPLIITFMGAEPDVFPLGVAYTRIVGLSLFFSLTSLILNGVLRGAGDMKTPMRVNIAANVLNLVGNYILIFGHLGFPALGVAGAAYATLFSRLAALIMVLLTFLSGKYVLRFHWLDDWRPDVAVMRRILRVGLPASAEQLTMRLGMMLYARTVAGLGTIAYAAHLIAITIEGLSFTPGMGFAMASTTMVGQGLGAERPDLAKRFGLEARFIAMLFMSTAGIILLIFARPLVSLYTDDPAVIALGVMCLRIIAVVQPMMASNFVMMGSLRGAGDTRFVMVITLIGIWGVRLTLAYFFVQVLGLGLMGAWFAMSLDQFTRGTLAFLRFRHGGWQQARV
ncbi:MAG: MATE family efflux transporter [Selenomonadales bacterium]|nr:MATE family efflux transporter [Selenomonadales bacterium]